MFFAKWTHQFQPFIPGYPLNSCNVTWYNRSNAAASSGVVFYPQYQTVDECLDGCAWMVPGCVAAQVRNATHPIQCFLLTNVNSLQNVWAAKDLSMYALTKQCGQGTQGEWCVVPNRHMHIKAKSCYKKSATWHLLYRQFPNRQIVDRTFLDRHFRDRQVLGHWKWPSAARTRRTMNWLSSDGPGSVVIPEKSCNYKPLLPQQQLGCGENIPQLMEVSQSLPVLCSVSWLYLVNSMT